MSLLKELYRSTNLKSDAIFSGPTLFGGKYSSVKISTPQNVDGIYFKRLDVKDSQYIKASLEQVFKTPRTTIIGQGDNQLALVEHLMAVLYVFGIKNALIEVDGDEIPIGDGSALHIVDAIQKAGYILATDRKFLSLSQSEHIKFNQQTIVAIPADRFKITYLLNYPNHKVLGSQNHTFEFSLDSFISEIAPCRTFAMKEEVDQMLKLGLLKSSSLDFGIVIDNEKILNPKGLRFENEMARHKILDFLGDFALADLDISMHNIALRSGHQTNIEFAKKIKNSSNSSTYDS